MMKLLRGIKVNKSGASAAEYALIVALIGGAIILAVTALGGSLRTLFTTESGAVSTATGKIGT